MLLQYDCQFIVSCIDSLVQLRVQCSKQILCWVLQIALEFVTFNLMLQCVCYSVDCEVHCEFGSADSTVLHTDCELWHSVCIRVCNI